jgi:hypothetical protein
MLTDVNASVMVQVWYATPWQQDTDRREHSSYIQTARDVNISDDMVVMEEFSLSDGQRVSQ